MDHINVVRRKLISLTQYIKEIEPLTAYSFDEYAGNYFIKRTGERLIQLVVENMVDINSVIISGKNHRPPKDYYSSLEILGELDILPVDFARNIAPCIGMRNRLVHEYDNVDDRIIFESIGKMISMVNKYIEYIVCYIESSN